MAAPAVPPRLAPPPKRNGAANNFSFKPTKGRQIGAQRIGIYGPGGCGKSSLAANLKAIGKRPLFLDVEDGSKELEVDRIGPADGLGSFDALRAALADDSLWSGYDVVVLDSLTRTEELIGDWVIANIPHEKGKTIVRLSDYGWGKEMDHVFNAFLSLLEDLERHTRAGRDVVLTAHECATEVPNPAGEDYLRFEPRLQSPKKGKSSIRHRYLEWLDHLLFIGYDVAAQDGKARGCGTRTIYPQEMPTHLAKSRRLADPIQYVKDEAEIWKLLYGDDSNASS